MKYINEIKEGEQVVEHYLCKSRQTFKSKNDKNYLSLKLADKTGTVDAKVWNLGNTVFFRKRHDKNRRYSSDF